MSRSRGAGFGKVRERVYGNGPGRIERVRRSSFCADSGLSYEEAKQYLESAKLKRRQRRAAAATKRARFNRQLLDRVARRNRERFGEQD